MLIYAVSKVRLCRPLVHRISEVKLFRNAFSTLKKTPGVSQEDHANFASRRSTFIAEVVRVT